MITIDDESSDSLSMDDMDEDEEMLDSELAHMDDEKSGKTEFGRYFL